MTAPDQRKADKDERRSRRCRHFNGIQNDACEAGINYRQEGIVPAKPRGLACFGDVDPQPCSNYQPNTPVEIAAEEAETARVLGLLVRGLSSCCEAPLDLSRVILDGQYKGHGPRFCSKCGKLAFRV